MPCDTISYEPMLSYSTISEVNIHQQVLKSPTQKDAVFQQFYSAMEARQRIVPQIAESDKKLIGRIVDLDQNITNFIKDNKNMINDNMLFEKFNVLDFYGNQRLERSYKLDEHFLHNYLEVVDGLTVTFTDMFTAPLFHVGASLQSLVEFSLTHYNGGSRPALDLLLQCADDLDSSALDVSNMFLSDECSYLTGFVDTVNNITGILHDFEAYYNSTQEALDFADDYVNLNVNYTPCVDALTPLHFALRHLSNSYAILLEGTIYESYSVAIQGSDTLYMFETLTYLLEEFSNFFSNNNVITFVNTLVLSSELNSSSHVLTVNWTHNLPMTLAPCNSILEYLSSTSPDEVISTLMEYFSNNHMLFSKHKSDWTTIQETITNLFEYHEERYSEVVTYIESYRNETSNKVSLEHNLSNVLIQRIMADETYASADTAALLRDWLSTYQQQINTIIDVYTLLNESTIPLQVPEGEYNLFSLPNTVFHPSVVYETIKVIKTNDSVYGPIIEEITQDYSNGMISLYKLQIDRIEELAASVQNMLHDVDQLMFHVRELTHNLASYKEDTTINSEFYM